MKRKVVRTLVVLILSAGGISAAAEGFDWKLLEGEWAESVESNFGCRPDNLHHRFQVSPDRKSLIFKLDRKWTIGTGQEVEQYAARIVRSEDNALVIRYGPELPGLSEEMREWEMRFVGPSTYRWRSTSWKAGQYNQVIGVKCKA
jgi:hypothetical protein